MEKQPGNNSFEKRCACTQTLYTCAWETGRLDKCAASPPENKGDEIVILPDFRQNWKILFRKFITRRQAAQLKQNGTELRKTTNFVEIDAR